MRYRITDTFLRQIENLHFWVRTTLKSLFFCDVLNASQFRLTNTLLIGMINT